MRFATILALASALGASECHLVNSFAAATTGRVRIVCVGNSVTHGSDLPDGAHIGFTESVATWFRGRFPDATVELETAIIFAIGPELQLFYLDETVAPLAPDLVVCEFGAANGAWGARGRTVTDPAVEGYMIRLRERLPRADVLLNIGMFRTMLDDWRAGREPPTNVWLKQLGAAYGCAVADSAGALWRLIEAGEPFENVMGDWIHPNAAGYEVHAATIAATLDREREDWDGRGPGDHVLPTPLHAAPWRAPRRITDLAGPGFVATDGGVTGGPGATLAVEAGTGHVVGLLLRDPPKETVLEARVDGGAWTPLGLGDEPRFQRRAEPDVTLARHFLPASGLAPAKRLELRVAGTQSVTIVAALAVE